MNSIEAAKKWRDAQNAKQVLKTELYNQTVYLQDHLNQLITATPTGDERNNYTNINILVLDILDKQNTLDSLK